MKEEFDAIMCKVRHSWDWNQWSAEDVIRELCSEKDAAKLIEQMEANRGRFRTRPMKGLLSTAWTSEREEFQSVWLDVLPEFVSGLPQGEKVQRFHTLCQNPENLRRINLERERVRLEQGEKARKLFAQGEGKELDEEDIPWQSRSKYLR